MKSDRSPKTGASMTIESSRSSEPEMNSREKRAFVLAQQAARRVIRRRLKVLRLTRDAYAKLGDGEGVMSRVADDLRAMLRLTMAWARREYRNVPWKAVVYIVAAILYFLNPADLIPDVLTGIGFVDDAAVIGAVVRSVQDELEAFRNWERSATEDVEAASIRSLASAA